MDNLAETIHSLLGFKAHLTSSWVNSVRDIIQNLPHEGSRANVETRGFFHNKDDEPVADIPKIKEQLSSVNGHINELNKQRRQVLNDFLDLKGNIRVFCRVRPSTLGEHFGCLRTIVTSDSRNVILKVADNKTNHYSFDRVFHPASSQDDVFSEVEPVIKSVLDGYNACIFAYGQTGTGKTFTMEGTPNCPGIVTCAIEALFEQAAESNHSFIISFSMLEIYLGNLKDLLIPQPTKPTDTLPPCLSIQSDRRGSVEIENLVALQVSDFHQALELYRLGCRFRSTASTNSNRTSSRSHCMIRITVTCFDGPERQRETNKIWFIDLGGSERAIKTKARGRRFDEGKAINLSLSALGDVVHALQRRKSHVPYRNSKLTQVLKDSLGEDSKTLMLVHISPKEEDLCETICSLNFATRVKSIHLGSDEPSAACSQKEIEMTNLQHNLKMMEDKLFHVRQEFHYLKRRLENLTGTAVSFEDYLDTSFISTEGQSFAFDTKKCGMTDLTKDSMSHIPRFMRSTSCSRRRSGRELQTSDQTDRVLPKRKPLHRAESVTFPVNNNLSCSSQCSISRSDLVVDLNIDGSADTEIEYSRGTSECDVKMTVLPEKFKSHTTSVPLKAKTNQPCISGSTQLSKSKSAKFHRDEHWLDLHKNEKATASRRRRVLAIPVPEKKHRLNGDKRTCDEKVPIHDQKMQISGSYSTTEKTLDVRKVGRSMSERVCDKRMTLKDLLGAEPKSDFIPPSHTAEDESKMMKWTNYNSTEEYASILQPDLCLNEVKLNKGECGSKITPLMQPAEGTTQHLESLKVQTSNFQLQCRMINSKCHPGVSNVLSEPELVGEQVPNERKTDDCGEEDIEACTAPLREATVPYRCKLNSQTAICVDAGSLDKIMDHMKSQEDTRKKGGNWLYKINLDQSTETIGNCVSSKS